MNGILNGFKVAILLTSGFQQIEMTSPRQILEQAGATVHIVSPIKKVQGWDCDIPHVMEEFVVDMSLDQAFNQEYDALLIPGGYGSPEELRLDQKAINFVKLFADKPIAAICHGPSLLIDAGLVHNKKLTSYPAIKQDLINAGAIWIDDAVVRDNNLITSRSPDDLEVFNKAIIDVFTKVHRQKVLK
jgi:protease I